MTEMIETLWYNLNHLPESGLAAFLINVIMTTILYVLGSKAIGAFCSLVRKHLGKLKMDEAAKSFILSFIKIGLYCVLILTVVGNLGIDKASIVALIGSAGVAVSLALQGGLSNFVGGLILLFLHPFKVGDYIIENGEKNEGIVEKIELYYTTLTTIDSRRIVIPNSTLTTNSIVNVTAQDKRRLQIKLGISPEDDLLKTKELLWNIVTNDPQVMTEEEIRIFVDDLTNNAVVLCIRVWVSTEEFWPTKWRLNEEIKLAFDREGIRITYPSMDLQIITK